MAFLLVLLKTSREDSEEVLRLVAVSGKPRPLSEGGEMSDESYGPESYRSEEKKDDVEAHELIEEVAEKTKPEEDKKDDFEAHELIE
jgi:hypothetical protein